MEKYWEKEFNISTQPNLKMKFKEQSPIDILAIANNVEMYVGTYDSNLYKNFLNSALENTLVLIDKTWLPLKDGNNYYPVYMENDLKGLKEVANIYFDEVIKPIFFTSETSTTEQQ